MTNPILYWNQIALDLVQKNHPDLINETKKADEPRAVEPDQPGPTRTSRAYAIVHLAMNDAWLGATGNTGTNYLALKGAAVPYPGAISAGAGIFAVAGAAAHALSVLYPQQPQKIADAIRDFMNENHQVPGSVSAAGTAYGESVARKLLDLRKDDGSKLDRTYVPRSGPGYHRLDPLNPGQGYLDPRWGEVEPFLVPGISGNFAVVPPPALNSADYRNDFIEVKSKGAKVSATRTTNETRVGLYWAYDGARDIGVPPRLYNQVVRAIAADNGVTDTTQLAQLFAAVNAAMADAGISAWHAKYRDNVWRPIVGIREADAGWGPTGDGTPGVDGDPFWQPLGAPRTNEPDKTALTPNFPAYPSGHATFCTACMQTVRRFFGVPAETDYSSHIPEHEDTITFSFVSDELDGKSVDNDGTIRTRYTHKFNSLEETIVENAESRIWLGVHWRFDANGGVRAGRAIGDEAARLFGFGSVGGGGGGGSPSAEAITGSGSPKANAQRKRGRK